MAYCGFFDTLININGEPVDHSRLDEGKIIVGDEEFDAEDFMTEEDRLDFFNETAIRTKKGLLKDIDSLLNRIDAESRTATKHSPAYYSRCRDLVKQFRDKVSGMTFPEKLEDWWAYEYDICGTGITLKLTHTDFYHIYADDSITTSTDTEFELFRIRTKLLTVEQYAKSYEVTTTTVRQWIRRGKIRTAIKQGSEWRIPELAEVMDRGYTFGHYERKEFLTDIPEGYEFFNEYDYVTIDRNREHKELFDICFSKKFDVNAYPESEWGQFFREMQMDQKEREKFELYLISSPFVESSESQISFKGETEKKED